MIIVLALIASLAWPARAAAEDAYMQVPAAMHISSTVSDGRYGIPEIAEICREEGIGVLVMTDRDRMRWEYGLPYLRRLARAAVERPSVSRSGFRGYLAELERVQRDNPGLLLVPGVETAPQYFWKGSLFRRTLALHNWHKHVLVIGMDGPSAYERMPVAGNIRGLSVTPRAEDLVLLWPAGMVIGGALLWRYRRRRAAGAAMVLAGAALLWNGSPPRMLFDQYADAGYLPYDTLFSYVHQRGGLTFWAHPEAANNDVFAGIPVETPEHSDDLRGTRGYTGFALFYEGYERVGRPGGIWDELLREYCGGLRPEPVWATAGLAFDRGDLRKALRDLRVVLLMRAFSREEALRALGQGRCYLMRGAGSGNFRLDIFSVSGTTSPRIRISGFYRDNRPCQAVLRLIRDGSIFREIAVGTPFDLSVEDAPLPPGRHYYRLELIAPDLYLVTNPLFVDTAK